MRYSVGVLLFALCGLTGCGANAPVTAHGKPLEYWVEKSRDPDAKTRIRAIRALGNAGASNPEVVPTLMAAVKDKQPEVRVQAIEALLRLGGGAGDAVPALTEARTDVDPRVRAAAARALEKITGS